MKGLVVYNGKYGSTEQYAAWIGESLGLPVRKAGKVSVRELESADYLVIGSSVHMGKLTASGKLKRWWPILAKKKVFFYTTSGTPADERVALERYLAASVPARLPGHILYPAGGRIDYSKYSPILKMLMRNVARSEFMNSHPGEAVPADIGTKVMDAVDRTWIEPLIRDAKALK